MPAAPPASPASVQLLVLDRIDDASNMVRFYVLSVERGCSVIPRWFASGAASG